MDRSLLQTGRAYRRCHSLLDEITAVNLAHVKDRIWNSLKYYAVGVYRYADEESAERLARLV